MALSQAFSRFKENLGEHGAPGVTGNEFRLLWHARRQRTLTAEAITLVERVAKESGNGVRALKELFSNQPAEGRVNAIIDGVRKRWYGDAIPATPEDAAKALAHFLRGAPEPQEKDRPGERQLREREAQEILAEAAACVPTDGGTFVAMGDPDHLEEGQLVDLMVPDGRTSRYRWCVESRSLRLLGSAAQQEVAARPAT